MPLLPFPISSTVALVAVGDPGRDRTVYATIVLLVALGFAMIMLAVWLLRNTRPDPEVLAPLERMGQRRWRRADPVWQRRHLDEVRPGGADPLEPTSAPPATDADFERGPQQIGFDDLVPSSAPDSAAAVGLPAPSADAQAVAGSLDIVHRDEQMAGGADPTGSAPESAAAGDATNVHGDAGLLDVGEIDDAASDHDAPDVTADVGPVGDDEDITGEQDTDDFLTVLDEVYELDSDVDPGADPDRGVEPDIDPDRGVEPVVDPDADPVVDVGADPDRGVEPDVDPDAEAGLEPEVRPTVEPELGVEPAGDHDVRSDVEPDIEDNDADAPG